MSNQDMVRQLLNQIADIAAVAGVRGAIDSEMGVFGANFGIKEGRDQTIYVRPSGEIAGKPMISFFSIAHSYPKTKLLSAISNKELLGLLMKNEKMAFARYGIQERESDYLVVASADHLLEALDADEFVATARFVAMAADEYEAEKGEDKP
jgi:hypothetical protein